MDSATGAITLTWDGGRESSRAVTVHATSDLAAPDWKTFTGTPTDIELTKGQLEAQGLTTDRLFFRATAE